MTPLVHELAADGYPVAVTCRVLKVPTTTCYDWLKPRPPSSRDLADAYLLDAILDIHRTARGTYGVRRVHAELTLGRGVRCCRQRVERLMRLHGLQGVHRRRWRHAHRSPAVFEDLVKRQFTADAPNRLWVTDITQHRTDQGWVYCAAVIDVYSRRCVGWSIADIYAPNWSSTPSTWPAGSANPPAPWSTPTAAPSTPPGCSAPGCVRPG